MEKTYRTHMELAREAAPLIVYSVQSTQTASRSAGRARHNLLRRRRLRVQADRVLKERTQADMRYREAQANTYHAREWGWCAPSPTACAPRARPEAPPHRSAAFAPPDDPCRQFSPTARERVASFRASTKPSIAPASRPRPAQRVKPSPLSLHLSDGGATAVRRSGESGPKDGCPRAGCEERVRHLERHGTG